MSKKLTIKEKTLIYIIKEFNKNKIHYAFARNYEKFPFSGRDIDFVSNENLFRIKKILLKTSKKFKWTYLIYDNYQNNKYSNVNNIEAFNFFLKKKNHSICLRIDFFRSFVLWGMPIQKSKQMRLIFNNKKKFYYLSKENEYFYKLLQLNSLSLKKDKLKHDIYKKKILKFFSTAKKRNLKCNYIFFFKLIMNSLKNNNMIKFKILINLSKILYLLKFFLLRPFIFFKFIFFRLIDYSNYYFFNVPGNIINFIINNENERKYLISTLNELKQKNFITNWRFKSSSFFLKFKERKILERRGILVVSNEKNHKNTINIKNYLKSYKLFYLIIDKIVGKYKII